MTNQPRDAWHELLAGERIDALRLIVVGVTVVLTWWLLLGWSWDTAVAAGDLKAQLRWPTLLAAAGGDWRGVLYDYSVLGGVPLHDAFGTTPLAQLLAWLGVGGLVATNLTAFFVQGGLAFFGASAVFDLAAAFSDRGGRRPPLRVEALPLVALVWLIGFSPLVLVRVANFHLNLLFGLLVFVTGVALIARARSRRWSGTFLLAAAAALSCALATFGYQIIFYALIFAGPLLAVLALWASDQASGLAPGERMVRFARHFWLPAAVVAVVLLLLLPRLAGMVDYAGGADFPRAQDQMYTYRAGGLNAQDWLASLPWNVELFAGRGGAKHERLYGLGPLLLLLGCVPWRRVRGLRFAVLLLIVGAFSFTLRLQPVTQGLVALFGILKMFQIPGRLLMVVGMSLHLLGLAGFFAAVAVARNAAPISRRAVLLGMIAVGIGGLLVFGLLPGWVVEALAWLTLLGWLWRSRGPSVPRLSRAVLVPLLLLLGLAGLRAASERMHRPLITSAELVTGPRQRGAALLAQQRTLDDPLQSPSKNPLVRVRQRNFPPKLMVNSAAISGLSSVGGYSNLTRGNLRLVEALRNKRTPMSAGWRFTGSDSYMPVLEALYNVGFHLWTRGPRFELRATNAAGPGAGWFPSRIDWLPDTAGMVATLRSQSDLRGFLRRQGFLVSTDGRVRRPEVRSAIAAGAAGVGCGEAAVQEVTFDESDQAVRARVQVPGDGACLLVLSMNFVERLVARGTAGAPLVTVPVYGALLGVLVPGGTEMVTVRPEAWEPWWSLVGWWIGLLGAIAIGLVALGRVRAGAVR